MVEDLRALEETRLEQREDWIAFGLFFMLIGGVDGLRLGPSRRLPRGRRY